MRRKPVLPPWLVRRHDHQLRVGGAIVAGRTRGARWDDLAKQFSLIDANAARSLAAGYLLALTEPRHASQDDSGEAQCELDPMDHPKPGA